MGVDIFTQTYRMDIQFVIVKKKYMKIASIQYQDNILMELNS